MMEIMRIAKRLLLIIGVLVAGCAATFIGFQNRSTIGIAAGTTWDMPSDFTFASSDFDDKGYYTPISLLSPLEIKPPSACGHTTLDCLCRGYPQLDLEHLQHPEDDSYVEARGWPLAFAYYHYTCGSVNSYLVIPLVLDVLFFAGIAGVPVLAVYLFLRSRRLPSRRYAR